MEKQCPTGFFLDTLLKDCIAQDTQKQKPVTEAVMSTVPPVQCWNFTVWISVCIVVVLSSSVLVLVLWVIINRRHSQGKGKRNSTCPNSHHDVNTNSYGKEDSCPPMNSRKQEVSDCEMGWGQSFCKARAEPAVPLPATELGDSALVTTKTVQLFDH
ncbi:hypothetical protein KOW79_011007 [Hemibagrus wyckioides]|uniref:Uncharacterized protein n=1 Tax=Hemibagrus wyckioides TaxID=337641 RepID=A0A9D3NPS3_9TELE|nr:hypothetical protein KOW79_011007 [Hemibagrus wyckioides]